MVKDDWTGREFLQPASICLVKTKDSHLKGAIGELVAWKYLMRHCWVESVAATWPASSLLFESALGLRCLNKRQLAYLKDHINRGMHRWDFLAIRNEEIDSLKLHSKNVENVYLVEVKTGVVEKGLAGFRERLSSDYAKIIPKAKSFGFTPILLKVGLADDWTFHISCRELR
jgi:hypothetical protein